MKNLIVYSSMYGATEKVAKELAAQLNGETVVSNASEKTVPGPDGFDNVILGSSIKVGKAGKPLRNYLTKYGEQLRNRRTALFLCSGDTNNDYFALNFAEPLVSQSVAVEYVGGALDLDKLGWFIRKMVGAVGVKESYDRIDPAKIKAIADAVNG